MATKKTTPSWTALLQSEMKRETRAPLGEGWKTLAEIRRDFPAGKVQTYRRLNNLIALGEVEVFRGTAKNASGVTSTQFWYRPISK